MANDRRIAELKADAECRRADDDAEKALSRIPIEQGGAQSFQNSFTDRPEVETAVVDLYYLNRRGEQIYDHGEPMRCLADVVMLDATELALILVCPSCKARNMPLDQCQIRVRQRNRGFELDNSKAGELIMWPESTDEAGRTVFKPYRSAGMIRESERFTCDCGWSARIAMNKIRCE